MTLPPVLSSPGFALAVGLARLGGGSDGIWRGALGTAQRQIPARIAGESKFARRIPSQPRVWSCVIAIYAPASERDAGLGQRREQRPVQQFVPQPAVKLSMEAFCKGLARRDAVPCDTALVGPC